MDTTRRLLRQWLTFGDGVLHISGKAGSGKSTLMKSIITSTDTAQRLTEWAGDKTPVVASFFFWRSDRECLELSVDELYPSILFEILRKCPRPVPEIFPRQWKSMASNPQNKSFEAHLFRPQSIKDAFENLVKSQTLPGSHTFCFFVDGLDEYQAHAFDQLALARQLREWSTNSAIKICVSSRLEIDAFSDIQRIHLHDLTSRDVYKFSQNMFERDRISHGGRAFIWISSKLSWQTQREFLSGLAWSRNIYWSRLGVTPVASDCGKRSTAHLQSLMPSTKKCSVVSAGKTRDLSTTWFS
ncbi:hypothetical protein B0T14DRAFT_526132 [Immersiella caudata]|uniref:Nephrocystin 3-like N-terminal domain-containing protein n=1 Tax=Immersiella caudata TaxID=314043 RepID=A0AA39WDH2_9PEZI|nr:hypothetical protein B0T14DRAFT_526132 [Immersiella caudata]